MEKLRLNDSAFSYEPESSLALGFGFRCGFLGLLHMDIVRERLEREFGLDPDRHGADRRLSGHHHRRGGPAGRQPGQAAPLGEIEQIEEPYILASIHVPEAYLGAVLKLCEDKRGKQREHPFPRA